MQQAETLSGRKKLPGRIIAGVAAFLAASIIATSGVAGAAAHNKDHPHNASVDQSSSQSVSIDHGYGGGNTSVATNINLAINNSNHNIIYFIVNIFN